MNILVYNGEGSSFETVKHTTNLLKLHLEPYYSVQPITKEQLLNEPWYDTRKSKMLVFPGGYDTPYVKLLAMENNKITNLILNKFHKGIVLGICAGGYLLSDRIDFKIPSQHIKQERPLKLFPGLVRGPQFDGFLYGDNSGAKVAKLTCNFGLKQAPFQTTAFFNGGGCFIDAEKYDNVEVLATYNDDSDLKAYTDGQETEFSDSSIGKNQAAVILCRPNSPSECTSVLMGPHLEYIPKIMAAAVGNGADLPAGMIENLNAECDSRDIFWKQLFQKLGLKTNQSTKSANFGDDLTLSPMYLHYRKAEDIGQIIESKDDIQECEADTFQIFNGYSNKSILTNHKGIFEVETTEIPKSIVLPSNEHENNSNENTPFFNSTEFFSKLLPNNKLVDILLLTEKISSTSILLDANPALMKETFKGRSVLSVGEVQLLGKGRSGNVWVSPKGVLAQTVSKNFTENKVGLKVFYLQYIAALAMCDALRDYFNPYSPYNYPPKSTSSFSLSNLDDEYCPIPVVIKWPNDLYILKPSYYHSHFKKSGLTLEEFIKTSIEGTTVDPNHFTKVTGILLNLKYTTKWEVLIGIGVNCFNKDPNPCINDWVEIIRSHYKEPIDLENLEELTFERITARYLNCLNSWLNHFENFDNPAILQSFLKRYYRYWMHSGQVVTLTDFGDTKCKILGISEDYGYLEAKDIAKGSVYQLKPDGNSFNIFEGLISKKVSS